MKFTWRTEWPLWLLLAIMFVIAAITWAHAPDRVPVHWGSNGEVDRYGGKFEGVLLFPLVALVLYALFLLLPRIDPHGASYARFAGAYTVLRFGILLVLGLIQFVIHLWIHGNHPRMETLIPVFVGGLFVLLGSVMGKLHPNWFVGVRTPWTLSSRLSWDKTHRLAGWVFGAFGICLIVAGASGHSGALVAAFILGGVGILGTVVYSYVVWRGDPERTRFGP